jgi:paraquat-inducible protein B
MLGILLSIINFMNIKEEDIEINILSKYSKFINENVRFWKME